MPVIVIPVNPAEAIHTFKPKSGNVPSEDERKLLVGGEKMAEGVIRNGWFQIIPHFTMYEGDKCVAIANEEGLIHGFARNERAIQAWAECLRGRTLRIPLVLVGPVVIFTGAEKNF